MENGKRGALCLPIAESNSLRPELMQYTERVGIDGHRGISVYKLTSTHHVAYLSQLSALSRLKSRPHILHVHYPAFGGYHDVFERLSHHIL